MDQIEKDCGPKCRSSLHAKQLIAAVSKGNWRQVQLFLSRCHNAGTLVDAFGRTVMHAAASCGKWEVVLWLIEERGSELNTRDRESGWTALHRALFCGQLITARMLISHGTNLQSYDKEGLAPLDILMKDRLPYVEFDNTGLNEVFTWGDNANCTLGHEHSQRKKSPEIVDFFRKSSTSIKQVVFSKFHTVFLSQAGQVYTCGHGRGGRLGHGTERTLLVPRLVEALKSEICSQVAAGRDHTVFLTESGAVYSCGINDSHQLGLQPLPQQCLVPKQIPLKVLKGQSVQGLCAQRFHTVLYTKTAVYTIGLNAGQIGHLKVPGEMHVSQPRQVTTYSQRDLQVKTVAASDAATVVATERGDVFVLHQYQCKKIVSRWLDLKQVLVSGGTLDHSTHTDTLSHGGGSQLCILLLNSSGRVYMWRDLDSVVRRCMWNLKRPLHITQLTLSTLNIGFVTKEGEAFVAYQPKNKQTTRSNSDHSTASSGMWMTAELTDHEIPVDMKVERVTLVHRAISITADHKGSNLAVLQASPKASIFEVPVVRDTNMSEQMKQLLLESDEGDSIHDVLIQVGKQEFAAHKFIVASGSEYFRNLFLEGSGSTEFESCQTVLRLEGIHPEIFQQLLMFIYTDTCDLVSVGKKFKLTFSEKESDKERNISRTSPKDSKDPDLSGSSDFELPTTGNVSAYEIYSATQKKSKSKKNKVNKTDIMEAPCRSKNNPVELLKATAKRLGVKQLLRRLDAVKYEDGCVTAVPGKHLPPAKLHFSRNKYGSLCDVCIQSQDGVAIKCHKCILVARLEYFKSMLASGWMETTDTEALTLPVPGSVLQYLLDFLYTDDATGLVAMEDTEWLCNLLVVADQLLIGRLKDMCEVVIAAQLSLKNVCEVLEFSSMYHAEQLKTTCHQFVTINLAVLLETRSLDVLSDEVLEEFSKYYKETVFGGQRLLTPYAGWPDREYLEALEVKYEGLELVSTDIMAGGDLDRVAPMPNTETSSPWVKSKPKAKKRRSRTKSTEEEIVKTRGERLLSSSSESGLILDVEMEKEEMEEIRSSIMPSTPEMPSSTPSPREKTSPWGHCTIIPPAAEAVLCKPGPAPIINSPPSRESTMVGLRAIMAEQSAPPSLLHKSLKQTQQKTSGTPSSQSRLSQRERKKIQRADSCTEDGVAVGEIETSPPPLVATNPWGQVDNVRKSFKELLVQEECSVMPCAVPKSVASPPRKGQLPVNVVKKQTPKSGFLPVHVAKQRNCQPGDLHTSPSASAAPPSPSSGGGDNPWPKPQVVVPSTQPRAVMFCDIVKDQMEQKETLERITNKPLALIQIEEQAIQELLYNYKAASTTEEYVTAERVHSQFAAPMWTATSARKMCFLE